MARVSVALPPCLSWPWLGHCRMHDRHIVAGTADVHGPGIGRGEGGGNRATGALGGWGPVSGTSSANCLGLVLALSFWVLALPLPGLAWASLAYN